MSDRHILLPEDAERILVAVPVGEANAKGWRWVWEIVDQWSPITLRNKLAILAEQGRVQRRELATNSGSMWVYWRDLPQPRSIEPFQSVGDAAAGIVEGLEQRRQKIA